MLEAVVEAAAVVVVDPVLEVVVADEVLDAEDELLPVEVELVVEPVAEELDDELVLLPEEVVEAELAEEDDELDDALEVDEDEDETDAAPATANWTL